MAFDGQEREQSPLTGGFWRHVPLALVLVAVLAVFATGLHRSLSFETFIRYQAALQELVAAHRLAMLGLYGLVYVAAVTLSLPVSAFLTVIGGYLFGWAIGGLAASLSATLGAVGIFLIARTSLGDFLLRRAGPRIQGLAEGFQHQGFTYLLSLRLIPVIPFWVTNLAAALFGMRLKAFVLATYVGMLPASFAFAFAGSGLDTAIARQEQIQKACLIRGEGPCTLDFSAKSLLTPELTIGLGLLGILALAPIVVKYARSRRRV